MSTTSPAGRSPINVPEHPWFYKLLWFCGMVVIAVALNTSRMTWSILLLKKFGITFSGGPTLILLAMIYLMLSLKEVGANEVAGAFCYGKALVRLSPGLHFIPLFLMQVLKAPRTVQEFQCPDDPERIFKGDDKETLPLGMVRPIRAVTRAPENIEKDILDTRMTLSVNFAVQYAITGIFDYTANFGSTEEIQKQLRDIGEVTIVEDITQNTPASFIKNLPKINLKLAEQVKERFENSGVNIISVRLLSPDISHEVSMALAGIPKARAEAAQVEAKAEGEKTRLTKEGEGKGAAELALLTAQANGRKVIMDALKVKGDIVLATEAVRGLSDKTDVLIVGAESGMRDVMGLVKGAQSALGTKTKKGVES